LEDNKLSSFKSLTTELNPWQIKDLEAYFDTSDLNIGTYQMQVDLKYDGQTTSSKKEIEIGKNINAEIVEEIPGTFNLMDALSVKNLLILTICIFLLLNLYLLSTIALKKRKKDHDIDEDVLKKVKELQKNYKDDYIKEMMIKKGWEKEKVDKILKLLK